jgi:murein L,D-transpeptidase YcbB/YkuD
MKTWTRSLILIALLVPTGCGKAGPTSGQVDAALRSRLGAWGGDVRGQKLLEASAVSRFYKARNGVHAWDGNDAQEILLAIHDIRNDGLDPADYHLAAIERLVEERARASTAALEADLDILLTDATSGMMDHTRFGRIRPVTLDPTWNVDPRQGAPPLELTVEKIAEDKSPRAAIEARKPRHFIYVGLKRALAELRETAAHGGWPGVRAGRGIRPGASDPRVPSIRARLAASGEYRGGNTATVYDPELQKAVELFETRHRMDPDGIIGPSVVAAMNVSPAARADQVRVNMERARWVLPGLNDEFLLVNLPAYKAYLIRGGRNVWEARTQIGDEGKQTPSFRSTMKTVVFNPDWTVPPMIIQDEVAKGGADYVTKKGLVVTDKDGREVDPSSVDWGQADTDGFPFTLKQPPGPDNALGRVKFLFPNPYSIYLHDTPSKASFDAEKRTFSHGCIRIEHPLELAQSLLAGQDGWSDSRIQDAIATDQTQNVNLAHPIPVVIVYWTVSVGANGEIRYMKDIYDLDPKVLQALGPSP